MNANQISSKNILNSDVELKGTLKFSGELTFDGKLDGDISSDGTLHLAEDHQELRQAMAASGATLAAPCGIQSLLKTRGIGGHRLQRGACHASDQIKDHRGDVPQVRARAT